MTASRTQATAASVNDHIAARASTAQQADCATLLALLSRLTGEPPTMWGPSIIGFGAYSYRYDSGRTGTACATGFAIRGRELVVYLNAEAEDQAALLGRLGPHRAGASCLYLKRLADIDMVVLELLIAGALAALRTRYPVDGA